MEQWKWIKGYKNRYMISNYGNVIAVSRKVKLTRKGKEQDRTTKEKPLTYNYSNGYARVALMTDKVNFRQTRVHQLVLIHFGTKPLKVLLNPGKYFVNHKDGNKNNNHIDNLEWMTPLENIRHSWDTGLRKTKYNNKQLILDYKNGMSYNEIATKHDAPYATVYKIIKDSTK